MRHVAVLGFVVLLASAAAAFLVSNTASGGRFVFESLPSDRRPADVLVDTEPVSGVQDPLFVTRDLMARWNAVPEAQAVFGTADPGGPYNGATVGDTFGTFTNRQFEVAFDDTGEILQSFGLGVGVLGITLKSVDTGSGRLLDFLVVVNTRPGALVAPGTGATAEELFRATLLHELGHGIGLGHSAVGMANTATGFGLLAAQPVQVPTMYPFRLPQQPQAGGSLELDDRAGLASVYPGDTSALGSIEGSVRMLSGAPVNEIAVRVVGPQGASPESHVGVISNADGADEGRFAIPNLPAGRYRVLIEAINGRSSVGEMVLTGGADALGGDPFVLATDELWQPGDTYDPDVDDPDAAAWVTVRAGRATRFVDFVLNAHPLLEGQTAAESLSNGDAVLPDAGGGFHLVDYFAFAGNSGQAATLRVNASGFTPQIRLLRPSDGAVIGTALPSAGSTATLDFDLPQSGIYTAAVSARATSGNPGGSGSYTLRLDGAGAALPAPPVPTAARVVAGTAAPGPQEFASPIRDVALLQVRVDTPSHEPLWLDRLTVRGAGTGDEALDVDRVCLVHDRNGDGVRNGGDVLLATGAFAADDGTVVFGDLGFEADPGTTANLLVCYDATVESVSSTARLAPLAVLALLALPWLRRRRRAAACVLLAALALVPVACGGGGNGFNGAFDPDGAIVTFRATVQPGDVALATPTSDPSAPGVFPATAIVSETLSVSN